MLNRELQFNHLYPRHHLLNYPQPSAIFVIILSGVIFQLLQTASYALQNTYYQTIIQLNLKYHVNISEF
ncbi:hypothetical protein, partial [Pedobacter sp.]